MDQDLRGIEIIRLEKLARETLGDELLDGALAGKVKDVSTVSRLFNFVRESFGPESASPATRKYWSAIAAFLADSGIDQHEINKIRKPQPVPYPNFGLFEEMLRDGLISQADYDFVQSL